MGIQGFQFPKPQVPLIGSSARFLHGLLKTLKFPVAAVCPHKLWNANIWNNLSLCPQAQRHKIRLWMFQDHKDYKLQTIVSVLEHLQIT